MEISKNQNIIQYVPFMSFVHPSFWHTLMEMKLNVDKLTETTKQIFGRYSYRDDIGAVFEVDGTSFNSTPEREPCYENVMGLIMNKNTIEEFKNMDKTNFLCSEGEKIWNNVESKAWVENPNVLLSFVILSFADLKKFNYYFWFAFPSPSQPVAYVKDRGNITTKFAKDDISNISLGHKALALNQKAFFVVDTENGVQVQSLNEYLKSKGKPIDSKSLYFGFLDPSHAENPGWPLRVFLAALVDTYPELVGVELNVIALRYGLKGDINKSMFLSLEIPKAEKTTVSSGWVGWERNERGNFGPRLANMSSSMDPIKLADTSSDLNIRLMKWRLVPDLNYEILKQTKCLLLGAGTLGCHVARDLLAWGFKHITFVDSGKVSYSNPTRQVLFTHKDCLAGGRMKAEAAADNLKLILPTVESRGVLLHIPMPGHPIGDSLKEETIANIEKLTKEISDHDVIFLLLDTREARWLPTLIAAHYGKIVINAALGFDSYLVMRHGIYSAPSDSPSNNMFVEGTQLGCYFCNDVTAPGNSVKDRTLDQQCTVSRPGASAIAAALAVELLAALLQHPLKIRAPAVCNLSSELDKGLSSELQGVLGPIPHSIRGFLHSFQSVLPTCVKFRQCIACSDTVVEMYRKLGTEFVLQVCDSAKYLEDITGLSELHLSAEMSDILTFSDDDDED